MAIFVNENTKVIVQGLTGGQGKYHGLRNRDYGTQIVGGVTPGKAGQDVEGIPIFDTVADAVAATGATASFVAVPPKAASAAILEAAAAGIEFIVCITEGIPAQDEAKVYNTLVRDFPNSRLLGPNCPGIISPGKCNIGITAGEIAQNPTADGPNVGIVSRSGTLTYQALYELKQKGIGVSTCVGIGGDPVPGTNFIDCLERFQADPETHAIMMIGEIGGSAEEEAAEYIAANVTKPMSAYIAGVTAPAGKKMGHAGAIVSGGKGTAQGKMDALAAAGVKVGPQPDRSRRVDGRDRRRPVTTHTTQKGRAPVPGTSARPFALRAQTTGGVGGAGGGGGGGISPSFFAPPKLLLSLSMSFRSLKLPPEAKKFMTAPASVMPVHTTARYIPVPRSTSKPPPTSRPPSRMRRIMRIAARPDAPRKISAQGWFSGSLPDAWRNASTPTATMRSQATPPVRK